MYNPCDQHDAPLTDYQQGWGEIEGRPHIQSVVDQNTAQGGTHGGSDASDAGDEAETGIDEEV